MLSKGEMEKRFAEGRRTVRGSLQGQTPQLGSTGDDTLKLIELLSGTWTSGAQGWNIIALPFKGPGQFRVLMNQYRERLDFTRAAISGVPNRGVTPDGNGDGDQSVDAIAYEQHITQVATDDCPLSNLKSANGEGIHHEPGFFLQLVNHVSVGHTEEEGEPNGPDEELKIARLATIPHGDSVLAMGTAKVFAGAPTTIAEENALPERINNTDINANRYLAPYKHFQDNPFFGNVPTTLPGFPGFFPIDANAILRFANPGARVKQTTHLHFDTKYRNAQLTSIPISNIPFVIREANATEMHADFWIMELSKLDESAPTEWVMQYSQTVYLEFFNSPDEPGKLIRWPHVSINTLKKSLS